MQITFFGLVALIALVFAAWTLTMFITLFGQRARVKARTGRAFPSLRDALADWRHWWRSPDLRGQRVILIGLTLLLCALTGLFAALLPKVL